MPRPIPPTTPYPRITSGNAWSWTPSAAMRNPALKQQAEVNSAWRGQTRSSHLPSTAAVSPRQTMATLKMAASEVSFQSPGADLVIPRSRVIGRLNTLIEYTWPMQRWMARAAGGASQRLRPGSAIILSLSRIPGMSDCSLSGFRYADDGRLRGRRIALVGDAIQGDEDVRFREICRGAAARDVVGGGKEAAGDALLAAEVAGEIDDLALGDAELVHVGAVEKHHPPFVREPAVAILQSIDRRVVLIVRADGHHQKLARREIVARQRVRGEVRLAR